jgi:hypothetical protein
LRFINGRWHNQPPILSINYKLLSGCRLDNLCLDFYLWSIALLPSQLQHKRWQSLPWESQKHLLRSPVTPTADRFTEKSLAQPPLGIAFAINPIAFADLDDRFAERAIGFSDFVGEIVVFGWSILRVHALK